MKWLTGRGPIPEPPRPDEWNLERRQKAQLFNLYGGDIQRAVVAWEAYQEDRGRYSKDSPHG